MALYISAGRRRRTTILIAVATALAGLVVGVVVGRASSSGVDDAVAESRAAARTFASSLQVLPLEYDKVAGDEAKARDLVERALAGEDELFELSPWLSDPTEAQLRADLAVIAAAPANGLEPADFNDAVDAAVADVEATFGLAASG